MAVVTIVELFASHVSRRMQIMSSGDCLEGHSQAIFLICETIFLHKLEVPSVDLGLQTISEALLAAFRTEDLRRSAS